ncbi:Molybdopterin biosynthesis MoaE [Coniella lustricola]|uniref:Molybdopterin synthase catalytic subunit n=1 Tax=Coniella lustricola TaxID=2025994 RepID=A0A2T2ZUS0_9PEZI|nr:Molybdopterin biosynthesis MoaE [Coniella lustricola]
MADKSSAMERVGPGFYVALTHGHLDAKDIMDRVRSPEAGAIVLFAGTTRNNFNARAVKDLTYTAYAPLALQTLQNIATKLLSTSFLCTTTSSNNPADDTTNASTPATPSKSTLKAIAIIHRLGPVPIGEESILIAVSAPHRKEAWLAGEECLEQVKERAEIWKLERFDAQDGRGEEVWRANRDGAAGVRVAREGEGKSESANDEGNDTRGKAKKGYESEEAVPETMGPVRMAKRPGEKGHGPVVNTQLT